MVASIWTRSGEAEFLREEILACCFWSCIERSLAHPSNEQRTFFLLSPADRLLKAWLILLVDYLWSAKDHVILPGTDYI